MNLTKQHRITAIFLVLILVISSIPPFKVKAAVAEYLSKDTVSLDFRPVDSVLDESRSLIYMTDSKNKRLVAFNYATKQFKSIQLQYEPENMALSGGELFVGLLKEPHDPGAVGTISKKGAIAIIDSSTFDTSSPKVKEQLDIDVDPYGITVDNMGNIFVSGGSGWKSELVCYSRSTKMRITSWEAFGKSRIAYNSKTNKVYALADYTMSVFPVSNGIIKNPYYFSDSASIWGEYNMLFSPDREYLFTTSKTRYILNTDKAGELIKHGSLSRTLTGGLALNMADRLLYAGDDKWINIYDYDTVDYLTSYRTSYKVNSLFYSSGKLAALTFDEASGSNFIEIINTGSNSIAHPPVLVSSSVEDGAMNQPLLNEIVLNFDRDIDISYIGGIDVKGGRLIDIDFTPIVEGKKLRIVFKDKLSYLTVYNLIITGGIVSKTSGQSISSSIKIEFSTGNQETLKNKPVQFIRDSRNISGTVSYEGDLVISRNSLYAVRQGSTLNVKGDLIVYGSLLNYGTLNVTGKIYVLNTNELIPASRQSYTGYYINKGTASGTLVVNGYPKPFMIISPGTDVTQDSNTQAFEIISYPDSLFYFNGQPYPLRNPDKSYPSQTNMYTYFPVRLKSGENIVKLGIADCLEKVYEKEIKVNCTLTAVRVTGVYPENIGSTPLPVNPRITLNFDAPLDWTDVEDYFTVIDNNTKKEYTMKAIVSSDKEGNPTQLILDHHDFKYYENPLPPSSSFTLTIPYNGVEGMSGASMDEDYTLTFTTADELIRLAGKDRYSTSVEISKEGWTRADNVVLATGDDFPDALCASPFARKLEGPLLLTSSKELSTDVFNEIKRLQARKVYIIGGRGAVSKSTEEVLTANGIEFERIQGRDRYETSYAIAREVGARYNSVFVATGNNFPDALSAAPFAADLETPILLTDDSNMPQYLRNFIGIHEITETLVIGGKGIISDEVLKSLPGAVRFGGSDRYETNYQLIAGISGTKWGEIDTNYTYFATGQNFPDALAGSVMAAYTESPIILVDKDMNPAMLRGLKSYKDSAKIKYILGGNGAVPQSLMEELFK